LLGPIIRYFSTIVYSASASNEVAIINSLDSFWISSLSWLLCLWLIMKATSVLSDNSWAQAWLGSSENLLKQSIFCSRPYQY